MIYIYIIEYLEKEREIDQFILVDINGDFLPELVASSSEGSWYKNQVFLYTVCDGELIELAKDIGPGMGHHYIAFYEGDNLIEISGGPNNDVCFYKMKSGKLSEERSYSAWNYLDEDGKYKYKYSINDKLVEEEYYDKDMEKFLSDYKGERFEIGADGLHRRRVYFYEGYLKHKDLGIEEYFNSKDMIFRLNEMRATK